LPQHYGPLNTYISKLDYKHESNLSSFNCTNSDQNDFLSSDALEYARLSLGVTYLLFDGASEKLLAFITLGTGAIKLPDKKEEWVLRGKKLKEYPKEFPRQFPALRIGQLATDCNEENKGAGTYLIHFAIRIGINLQANAGCAYLVANPYPERVPWYEKRGFKILQEGKNTTQMYFELP